MVTIKKIIALFLALMLSHAADAAVAYSDSTASGTAASSTHVAIWTVPSGTDLVLVVGVCANDGTTGDRDVSSVTWGVQSLTKAAESDDTAEFDNTETWYLVNPTSGSGTLTVTMGGTCTIVSIAAAVYSGVDQVSPIDATDIEDEATAASSTSTITTVTANSMIVSNLCCHNQSRTVSTLTSGNIRQNGDVGTAYDQALGDITTTTAGNYDIIWTLSALTSAMQQTNVALKPSSGGGSPAIQRIGSSGWMFRGMGQ